jgi:hypothetical protein
MRSRRSTELDRQIRAEMRAERRAGLDARPWGALRRRLDWPVAVVGALVLVASYVGSMAELPVLPFDDHHLIGQFGGGITAAIGAIWATTGGTPTGDGDSSPPRGATSPSSSTGRASGSDDASVLIEAPSRRRGPVRTGWGAGSERIGGDAGTVARHQAGIVLRTGPDHGRHQDEPHEP